ncbi:MAG: cytochrome b N-terminal domain-containing protein [Thermoguttaceae bacterium]|nr:cytochrome b N-terminal domain-containing protein [Thermoguttaceae bacterium]MDW8078986.1 cytochrome b N-terminal domain-containing protein [Thermoguttaceae bacterium]
MESAVPENTSASERQLSQCRVSQILTGVGNWLEDRTGLVSCVGRASGRLLPGGVSWCRVWPSALLFLAILQVVTGAILWMHYSPSAQTAWESVFYIQYQLPGGWLVRGIHHYSAQLLVAVAGLYLLHLVFSGGYRPPREWVWWTALLLLVLGLGGCLTGDLLSWDINGFSATQVRVGFLTLIPGIGDDLFRLAAGGPSFGHHTLTRFFTLHVGAMAGGLLLVLICHLLLLRRAERISSSPLPQCAVCAYLRGFWKTGRLVGPSPADRSVIYADEPYWPGQFWRNALVWLVLMAIILVLVFHPWKKPEGGVGGQWGDYGARLLAPADPDPAAFYSAARPEWSFRGLYQLANMFPGGSIFGLGVSWKIVPIFVLPGLAGLFFLAMPFIALVRGGHLVNIVLVSLVTVALVGLSAASYWHDATNKHFQEAVAEANEMASRAKILALAGGGIPPEGALSLLYRDPKTRGKKLFQTHCAICHDYPGPQELAIRAEQPSAPQLYGVASKNWLEGLFDPKRVAGPEYFGNTRFAASAMVRYVEGRWSKLPQEEKQAIIEALAAEAKGRSFATGPGNEVVAKGRQLIREHCTQCHQYEGVGPVGFTPTLDGYGSYAWLIGIIADPTNGLFYGPRNDRMPSYWLSATDPGENRLQGDDVAVLSRFLLGEWVERGQAPPVREPFLFVAGLWEGKRPAEVPPGDSPAGRARWLYQKELCALCHSMTGVAGEADIVAFKPAGADLGNYGTREWIAGWFDRKLVATPRYFGATAFASGSMVKFVRTSLPELIVEVGKESFDKLIDALAAEAARDAPLAKDQIDEEILQLFEDFTCTDCHSFYGKGGGTGPDLTGYASRQWTKAILANPAHERFYGTRNDGMPSYRAFPEDSAKNLLTEEELDVLVDWLRRSVKKSATSAQ